MTLSYMHVPDDEGIETPGSPVTWMAYMPAYMHVPDDEGIETYINESVRSAHLVQTYMHVPDDEGIETTSRSVTE